MSAIIATKLTKYYKDLCAVNALDLEIRDGELFSLLGVNGAGKTTTIKMLSCLSKVSSGNAILLGDSILKNQLKVKEKIAVSPQETAVAPGLSVKENLSFMCGVNGFDKERTKQKVISILEQFKMNEIKDKTAKTLSGGWQRRLSIAMALITEPKILFLDEPTLGLDVLARRDLWSIIKDLKGKITVILTTHYMEEAEALSDRIGIMAKGKLVSIGTAKELMEQTGTGNFEDAFIHIAEQGGATV